MNVVGGGVLDALWRCGVVSVGPRLSGAKSGSEQCLPLQGKQPHERASFAGWRRSLYYHFYEYPAEHMVKRHYGVRNDRWKLIHFYNDIDQWELYDLQEDPHELRNLYGLPEYAAPRREMTDELVRLQTQYGDTLALRRNGRVTAANGN